MTGRLHSGRGSSALSRLGPMGKPEWFQQRGPPLLRLRGVWGGDNVSLRRTINDTQPKPGRCHGMNH